MKYDAKYEVKVPMYLGTMDLKLSALVMGLLLACAQDSDLQCELPMDALALDYDLALSELIGYLDTLAEYKYIRYNTDNDVLNVQYNSSLQVA